MNKPKYERLEKTAENNDEPLCLFYFSQRGEDEKGSNYETARTQHYEASTKPTKRSRTKRGLALTAQNIDNSSGDSDEAEKPSLSVRPRRKKDGRKQRHKFRRFGRETPHHLTTYLLSSAKPALLADTLLPLTDVLTTIQDAWPTQKLQLERDEEEGQRRVEQDNMKLSTSESTKVSEAPVKLIRRRSVPEEIIRKFTVSKEQTSPESEATATMPEAPSSSGKEAQESSEHERVRSNVKGDKMKARAFAKRVEEGSKEQEEWIKRSFRIMEEPNRSAEEGSSDSDSDAPGMQRFNTIKRAPLRRESVIIDYPTKNTSEGKLPSQDSATFRVSQKDFYRNGQGILRPRVSEKYCQTGDCTCRSANENSGTTPSAQEETESADSSDTISSPTLCTRQLTSSDNQSSDSEGIQCTCTELTSSKDTSADPYHSGKSTLSQTVSDKSVSTQDSTISINSVSTGGSSISAPSGSSSPDIDPKTSAKESTTSPDHTPRTQRENNSRDGSTSNGKPDSVIHDEGKHNQHNRNQREKHSRSCPRYNQSNSQRGSRQCRQNAELRQKTTRSNPYSDQLSPTNNEERLTQNNTLIKAARIYEWENKSEEEISVKLKQLQSRFVDNNREFTTPLSGVPLVSSGTVSLCSGAGSFYHSTENIEGLPLMVPRYSALPRSLSMVVNTSSLEVSHNSDSESIADSLEDERNAEPVVYYDTKNETKPVRGDVKEAVVPRKKWKFNHPRGKAYFVSIDNEGEEEIVTDIYKIPEPPDKIKNNIFERHANICKNRASRDKMHQENEMPTPKPTFTKKIRRERKKKQQELRETSNELKSSSKKQLPRIKRLKGPSKDTKASVKNEAKPSKEMMWNVGKTEQTNSSRQEKHFTSRIPTLVKSPSNSPNKDVPSKDSTIQHNGDQKDNSYGGQILEEIHSAPPKPQAVIHPSPTASLLNSQVDLEALKRHRLSLISSLESTAVILKAQQQNLAPSRQQQWTKNQTGGTKRPNKFQQKFEVIPEERSSSMSSSAEDRMPEKDRRRSLPVKLAETLRSPNLLTLDSQGKLFRRYSLGSLSNYIISKLMGRPLQAIPCVQRGPNNDQKQIIVFSPKDTSENNSVKGRDALIAMNREDFDRLSKGWMNFYLLKEDSDEEINLGEELTHSFTYQEEQELGNLLLKSEDAALSPGGNTIICRIPSMEKDPTTSGSGTDETSASQGHCEPSNLDFERFRKRYSLLLKDAEADCFELQEYRSEVDCATKSSGSSDNNKNRNETDNQTNRSPKGKHQANKSTSTESQTVFPDFDIEAQGFNELISEQGECEKEKFPRNEKETYIKSNDEEMVEKKTLEEKENKRNKLITRPVTRSDKLLGRLTGCGRTDNLRLSEDLKFNSSNTVLRTTNLISVSPGHFNNCTSRGLSLPELPTEPKRNRIHQKATSAVDSLPRMAISSGSEDIDSDSTVYMQAPSPQIPLLPLDECTDCNSSDLSSPSDDAETKKKCLKPIQRVSKPTHPRNRALPNDSKRSYKSDKSGWSVTVAGSVVFPQNTPDVQMRLSFPAGGGPPHISQSDSGFVEERFTRPRAATQRKQEWTVTVKNPRAGPTIEKHKTALPTLNQQDMGRTTKRVSKVKSEDLELETIVRKMPEIWSKVQGMIEEELKYWRREAEWQQKKECLLVSGRAMPFDNKPKPTKMSDKDVTRNSTARTNSVQQSSKETSNEAKESY